MPNEKVLIQQYRTKSGNAPDPQNLLYGQIAIGYKKDKEAIYFKNDNNEIVTVNPAIGSIRFIDEDDEVAATMPLINNTPKGTYARNNGDEPISIGEWDEVES